MRKYQGEVPRYTSYPTAPNFSSAFTALDYRQHAKHSNEVLLPRDLSIYVHIPFCHSLCYFCGCNKVVTQCNNQKVESYLDSLMKEIELRAALFDQDRKVTQIHFGGGTPNFLSVEQLSEILEKIASCFHLDLPTRLEISIEVDPRATAPTGIQELAQIGFNRFSIGVQDFAPLVQASINRRQSEADTLRVIEAALSESDSVSVDLITGLPNQTLSSFQTTLDTVVATGVTRIAAYKFAYLPKQIKAQRKIDPVCLPDAEQRFELTRLVQNTLGAASYNHIGMDHFASNTDPLTAALRDGTLQRNFQGYTTKAETDLIGFGASAISQFNNAFAQNYSGLSDYNAALSDAELPISKGLSLSADDVLRAALIQQIMCQNNIDLERDIGAYTQSKNRQTLRSYFAQELAVLKPFLDDGLIDECARGFAILPRGRHMRRQLAACFDTYLGANTNSAGSNVVQFSTSL